jgi:hypothetical protein
MATAAANLGYRQVIAYPTLYVRSSASTTASIIGSLAYCSTVYVYAKLGASGGYNWVSILYGTRTAYVALSATDGTDIRLANYPATTCSVTCGSGSITSVTLPWNPITAPVQTKPNARSRPCYDKLIDQFNVATNGRYSYDSRYTYCNIFVWDVTRASNAEVRLSQSTSACRFQSLQISFPGHGT